VDGSWGEEVEESDVLGLTGRGGLFSYSHLDAGESVDLPRLRARVTSDVLEKDVRNFSQISKWCKSAPPRDYSQPFLDCHCSISEHKFSRDSKIFRLGEGTLRAGYEKKPEI
jgi:hypothetical protein